MLKRSCSGLRQEISETEGHDVRTPPAPRNRHRSRSVPEDLCGAGAFACQSLFIPIHPRSPQRGYTESLIALAPLRAPLGTGVTKPFRRSQFAPNRITV